MGIIRKKKTLRRELIKYMLTLSFSLIAITALYVLVNMIGMNAGLFYPANYNEIEAEKLKPRLQSAEQITEDMIRIQCCTPYWTKSRNKRQRET